ncbi:hypothetical protein V493_01339 [Pseudogymnoascus sp. VKM F-4281 (FW-2241)]|nr:hypothetical protein V493_01339 [Pseudogymnoascus sp. VKM F-4281 (FW-2241)]
MGFSILAVAALAASALAIEIPTAPTWPSGRCTDKSLTIPSWILSEYEVSDGITTFKVDSRSADPTGLYAIIECKGEGVCSGSSGSSGMTVNYSQGLDGPLISISHFWVCGDEGDKIIFTASGSTTITQCAGSNCVSPIPYLIQGTLSLPVPVTPTQPSPPPGYDAESCATVGDKQWTVTDVSYQNYTKGQCLQWYWEDRICLDDLENDATDFKARGVHVNINVTNNAIDHEVTCSFTPNYDNNYKIPYPLRCTGGEFNEITLDITLSGAVPNLDIKVEEVWYCLEDPSNNVNPTVISATGSTTLQLTCASSTGITGAEDDIITKCTNFVPYAIDGTQTDKQTLQEFALVTAYPVHGGCTFDSVVNPTWYFRGMRFTTTEFPANDPDSAMLSSFTTGLTGPGFADYWIYYFDTYNIISGTGLDTVYDCYGIGNGQPIHWKCNYGFNPFTRVMRLNKVWQCTDKDEAHPIYFEGSGNFDWSIYPYARCTNGDTYRECSYDGDLATLQPGIPYDIPKVTTSLTNAPQSRIETLRVNEKWAVAN